MDTGDKYRFSSLKYRLEEVPAHDSQHSIYKVPRKLRDVNNKAYEPEMVAIGPYHHGNDNFGMMEEVKVRFMQSLLRRKYGSYSACYDVDSYLSAIAEVEDEARSYYAEPIMPNSDEFVEMLVRDGCFIIQLISEHTSHEHTTYIPPRLRNSVHRDLMLLENQIPFFVLCKLFDLIEGPEKHHNIFKEDVLRFCEHIFPVGLLSQKKKMEISGKEAKHILDLIHRICILTSPCPSVNVQITTTGPLQIPTSSELIKDVNFNFMHEEIRCTSLFDVEFEDGEMVMPTLVIDGSTESLLKNHIAYEQYLSSDELTPFTDYAVLLNSLIDSAEDVEILTRCGIIDNKLGNNQAVADFVNQLTHKRIYYSDNFMHLDIFNRIKAHHHNPWIRIETMCCNRALDHKILSFCILGILSYTIYISFLK